MAKPLFNKNISPACKYCLHGHLSEYTDEVFCLKRGVTKPDDACRKFIYDVLKRTPSVATPDTDFKKEDFEI